MCIKFVLNMCGWTTEGLILVYKHLSIVIVDVRTDSLYLYTGNVRYNLESGRIIPQWDLNFSILSKYDITGSAMCQ